MLQHLRVHDFAIIEDLELELGPGLTVITGETGAGKSILVDALELVLGGRGRPEVVRTGAEQAEVEAIFDVQAATVLRSALERDGFEAGDELIVRRVVQATGRTRAYVNGRLATATQLTAIARELADISSQHEHHKLTEPHTHLEVLDAFAGLEAERGRMSEAHAALVQAATALANAKGVAVDREQREDLLRYQLHEIDELELRAGDEETVREERERLRHAERLAAVATGAEHALYARDEAVTEELGRVSLELRDAARLDGSLLPFVSTIDRLRAEVEEMARDLGHYARGVVADPERLAALDERLDRIGRLKRKYGGSVEAILTHRERASAELSAIDGNDELVRQLSVAQDERLGEASKLALAMSEARRRAASALAKAVGSNLASLGMSGARVEIEVARVDAKQDDLAVEGAKLGALGLDRVELLISPNRGEQARPLRKIASGGELSRVMLAIERVLGAVRRAGTHVFDEVDSGVGGAVAEVIGRKLKELARHQQVLCITHLPQVAVYGDAHLRVLKQVDKGRTKSTVERLDRDRRLDEVARMLGGLRVTGKTRAAAEELLRGAQRAA